MLILLLSSLALVDISIDFLFLVLLLKKIEFYVGQIVEVLHNFDLVICWKK